MTDPHGGPHYIHIAEEGAPEEATQGICVPSKGAAESNTSPLTYCKSQNNHFAADRLQGAASSITGATANATASSSTSMSDSLLPNSQNGRPQHHSNMRRRLDDSAAVGRHVHFSDEIQGILVPSPKDMPENEKRSIWYNVRFVLLSACFVCLALHQNFAR